MAISQSRGNRTSPVHFKSAKKSFFLLVKSPSPYNLPSRAHFLMSIDISLLAEVLEGSSLMELILTPFECP